MTFVSLLPSLPLPRRLIGADAVWVSSVPGRRCPSRRRRARGRGRSGWDGVVRLIMAQRGHGECRSVPSTAKTQLTESGSSAADGVHVPALPRVGEAICAGSQEHGLHPPGIMRVSSRSSPRAKGELTGQLARSVNRRVGGCPLSALNVIIVLLFICQASALMSLGTATHRL